MAATPEFALERTMQDTNIMNSQSPCPLVFMNNSVSLPASSVPLTMYPGYFGCAQLPGWNTYDSANWYNYPTADVSDSFRFCI